jgi:hypothetical protein
MKIADGIRVAECSCPGGTGPGRRHVPCRTARRPVLLLHEVPARKASASTFRLTLDLGDTAMLRPGALARAACLVSVVYPLAGWGHGTAQSTLVEVVDVPRAIVAAIRSDLLSLVQSVHLTC